MSMICRLGIFQTRAYHHAMDADTARAVHAGKPKTKLLAAADLPDTFTRSLYKVSPYRGCAHGCRYCDGRAERYYVEGDFEKDIIERRDIPDRFLRDISKVRERGLVAFGSGTTDPYQCREGELGIVRACAGLLADGPFPALGPLPALVMTKSSSVTGDLPLWTKVARQAGFVLMVSLTSLDEDVRRVMEPGASPFAERVAALRAFKAAGCATGILAMPLLPGITDGEDNIRRLYELAGSIGVDFLMPGGLTLRPGRQKDLYLSTIKAWRPDLLDWTIDLYREERPSGAPTRNASGALFQRIGAIRRESGIPFLLPHHLTARLLPPHDALRLLLRDMVELYSERGVAVHALKGSADAYDLWLIAQRRRFRRTRSLPAAWLEESLPRAARDGTLSRVLDNPKLTRFCESILFDGARLDYLTLKLG